MEEGDSSWSNERNRVSASNLSSANPSLYTRFTQNDVDTPGDPHELPTRKFSQTFSPWLSRSHGPLMLGRVQEESSRLIRNNVSSVIIELGPLMDSRQREGGGLNLRSWIRRQHQTDRGLSQNQIGTTPENTVIDFGNSSEISQNVPQSIRSPSQQETFASNSGVNLSDNSNETYGGEEQENNSSDNQNPNPNSNSSVTIPTGPNVDSPQTEETNQDMQSIVAFFQTYVPFVIILLGKAIYDHRTGILIFLGLIVTFTRADSVVKREIAKQSRRSLFSLFFLFINLLFCICFIYYVFQDQQLYKSLILIPPYSQPLSLWDLLWIVGITDFVLKFITIQIKAGMACFPARLLPYSTRGKWYLFLESISQFYRGLVPIQPWLYYLLESYQGPEKVIGVFLSAAYMVSKGPDLVSKVKLFKGAFWKLLQNVSLGVSPSKEQLDTAGSQCPICHDEYETPVLLNCRHVFCEACVTTWFDREQTCPLCRTKVADDPKWKDGATTFFAQLF